MNPNVEITYLPAESVPLEDLTYVVIGARENGKWIFVRHQDRDSWELPAGHVEPGESASDAARRELYEETGTSRSEMEVLWDYSVRMNGSLKYGRIFFARVLDRGEKPDSEIAEIAIQEETPSRATYPVAHASFLEKLKEYLDSLPKA